MRGARGKRWRENRSQRHKDAGVGYKGAFVCIDAYARETDGAADDAIGSEGLVEDDGAGDDHDDPLDCVAHRLQTDAREQAVRRAEVGLCAHTHKRTPHAGLGAINRGIRTRLLVFLSFHFL